MRKRAHGSLEAELGADVGRAAAEGDRDPPRCHRRDAVLHRIAGPAGEDHYGALREGDRDWRGKLARADGGDPLAEEDVRLRAERERAERALEGGPSSSAVNCAFRSAALNVHGGER